MRCASVRTAPPRSFGSAGRCDSVTTLPRTEPRTDADDGRCRGMSDASPDATTTQIIDARRREMAIEHLLFGTIRFVAHRHPELLQELDGSLDHLWDKAEGTARDDEAVRTIARRFIKGLRAET